MISQRPSWAEVNLSAIAHNLSQFRKIVPGRTRLCAVVKADAYGHGSVPVANRALAAGADFLAVAIMQEAVTLRENGLTCPLLVMGYTPAVQAMTAVSNAVSQTVYCLDHAEALSAAGRALGMTARVHIKVETGMGRLGILAEEAVLFAQAVSRLPNIMIEGMFTHFAQADCADKAYSSQQLEVFLDVVKAVGESGVKVPIIHCANSAAALALPETHLDMVRIGVSLYGLWPSDDVVRGVDLIPAMKFKTTVAHCKTLPPGKGISYGSRYVTPGYRTIATLPVGYADGWSRMLSHKASVLINGVFASVVGNICMDQCMIDVTEVPGVIVGTEALLFGGPALPVEKVAKQLGTINYEVVCMVSKRVPRIYIEEEDQPLPSK